MIHTQHKVFDLFQELIFSKQKKKKKMVIFFWNYSNTSSAAFPTSSNVLQFRWRGGGGDVIWEGRPLGQMYGGYLGCFLPYTVIFS